MCACVMSRASCASVNVYACIIDVHTHIHTHINTYTHTHIHTYVHTYVHTYTVSSLSREMCVSRTSNDGRTHMHKCTNICTVRPVSECYRTRVAGGGSSKTEHTLQNRAATAPMLQHTSGMNERVCIHACVGLSPEGLGYAHM